MASQRAEQRRAADARLVCFGAVIWDMITGIFHDYRGPYGLPRMMGRIVSYECFRFDFPDNVGHLRMRSSDEYTALRGGVYGRIVGWICILVQNRMCLR